MFMMRDPNPIAGSAVDIAIELRCKSVGTIYLDDLAQGINDAVDNLQLDTEVEVVDINIEIVGGRYKLSPP